MDQERGNNPFHETGDEPDDLYTLYNLCNGRLHKGVLDVQALDELSEQEAALFDMDRLRRLGEHVASRCEQCEAVINMLNMARQSLRRAAEEPYRDQPQLQDANHLDSRWKHRH